MPITLRCLHSNSNAHCIHFYISTSSEQQHRHARMIYLQISFYAFLLIEIYTIPGITYNTRNYLQIPIITYNFRNYIRSRFELEPFSLAGSISFPLLHRMISCGICQNVVNVINNKCSRYIAGKTGVRCCLSFSCNTRNCT